MIASETTPLVPAGASKKPKTPLPKVQISILMMLHIADPIASMSIFPYINQVCFTMTPHLSATSIFDAVSFFSAYQRTWHHWRE